MRVSPLHRYALWLQRGCLQYRLASFPRRHLRLCRLTSHPSWHNSGKHIRVTLVFILSTPRWPKSERSVMRLKSRPIKLKRIWGNCATERQGRFNKQSWPHLKSCWRHWQIGLLLPPRKRHLMLSRGLGGVLLHKKPEAIG